MEDLNVVMRERIQKAEQMEEAGIPIYPNGYSVPDHIQDLIETHGNKSSEELEAESQSFTAAGRVMSVRSFGKSIFMHLLDAEAKIQIYIQQNQVGKEIYELVKKIDIGDIIRVSGNLFRTRTQELTLLVKEIILLTKNLRPLPEKYHGLKDVEIRYRQRYVDLIVHESVREIFRKRARIIQTIRQFLNERGYLEVDRRHQCCGGRIVEPVFTRRQRRCVDRRRRRLRRRRQRHSGTHPCVCIEIVHVDA